MSYVKFQINLKNKKKTKICPKRAKVTANKQSSIIKTCAESLIFLEMVKIGRKNITGYYLSNILPPKMCPLTKDSQFHLNNYYIKTYIRD